MATIEVLRKALPVQYCRFATHGLFSCYELTQKQTIQPTVTFERILATIHLTSWEQLLSTAYGRALLLTSAIHVGLLRPRLKADTHPATHARQQAS